MMTRRREKARSFVILDPFSLTPLRQDHHRNHYQSQSLSIIIYYSTTIYNILANKTNISQYDNTHTYIDDQDKNGYKST